jgi:hypothetical protein
MVSKSDTVRELVAAGEYKRALRLSKDFRLGIGAEDTSKLRLAYESMVHTAFYQELGINTAAAITEGIQVLQALYGQRD